MNKLLSILIVITLTINLVSAQEVDGEQFRSYQLYLEDNQKLNDEIIADLETMSPDQREELLSYLDKDSSDFWGQWNKDLNGQQKRDLLRDIPVETRNKFMADYGEQFGVEFKNLGDEEILFGDGNTVGNKQGFFQMDMVDKYNKRNPSNPITSIEYTKTEAGSSLIYSKKDGSSLDLTVGNSERGFYYNPDSGFIGRIGSEGAVDNNDPFTGEWNGKGAVKIDASAEGVKMSFDFTRDGEGKALGDSEFPKFENSKGESYSTFRHPAGEGEDGQSKYDLVGGELGFDKDGKLIRAHNMYKNKGEDTWGGFFGEDTAVTYNDADYQTAEGSKVMVDLEKGAIKAEVKRVQTGPAAEGVKWLEGMKKKITDFGDELSEGAEGAKRGYEVISGARKSVESLQAELTEVQKAIDDPKTGTFDKLKLRGSKLSLDTQILAQQKIIDVAESTARIEIAKALKLDPIKNPEVLRSPLVKALASETGLSLGSSLLSYGSEKVGAAGDLATSLGSLVGKIDDPVLGVFTPAEGARVNLQLSNQFAREINDVEMYAGSLEVADSSGRLSTVVDRATPYGYVLPSTINNRGRSFNGIDFNLQNNNFEGGQSIKVYSQNGHLNAAGVGGLDALRSKNGQFVVNAGGGISYGYNILFFRGGGQEGEYNQVLTADYKVTSASAQKAAQFETTANTEYRNLYNQYKNNADKSGNNVWTSSEIAELNALKDKQFIEYNQILNSGDTQLSVRSSELSSILSKATGSTGGGQRDPIINQILGNAFESNPALLGLARERGIATGSDKSVIESQITNFLGSELDRIGSHLKAHPGSSFIYRQDVSNGVYQIISGGSTYNVDPLAGPSVGNLIPVLISHAGVNSNGVYIDQANSRFGKTIGVYINGGHYEGISASLRASRNAAGIKAGIQASAESEVARQLANPNSGNPNGRYQTYQSGYSASSGQVCNRCGQVHQTTTQSYRRSGGTSRAARSYGSR